MLLSTGRSIGKFGCHGFELEGDAGETLSQRVVKIARDAVALGQHDRELGLGPTHAMPVKTPTACCQSQRRHYVKPGPLIKMRQQRKGERCPGFIPNAVAIAPDDTKPMIAGWDPVVKGNTSPVRINPRIVHSLEL